jgi:hypothetical protein
MVSSRGVIMLTHYQSPRAPSRIETTLRLASCLFFLELWPLKMGPIRCPETSVNNYHTTPRNIPEESRTLVYWLDLSLPLTPARNPVTTARGGTRFIFPVSLNIFRTVHITDFFGALQSAGCALAEAVNRLPLTAEAGVRSQASPYVICGEGWHWDRFFFEYVSFSLSISVHQCYVDTFHSCTVLVTNSVIK